jgi:hypothetical protein
MNKERENKTEELDGQVSQQFLFSVSNKEEWG